MSDPVDDSGNYTQPVTVAGPTKFTGVATAATAEQAEAIARDAAKNQAVGTYGATTTEFVSFDEIRIKFNPSTTTTPTAGQLNTPGFTGELNTTGSYTATVVTTAIQVAPPAVSGLSETEQQAFLDANNALQGEEITAERQAFLDANAEPQTVTDEPSAERLAFLAANTEPQNTGPATVTDEPSAERLAFLAANTEPQNTGPATVTDEPSNKKEEQLGFVPGNPDALEAGQSASITVTGTKNKPQAEIAKSMDWRFRISLSPGAEYLYKMPGINKDHILYPLAATNGVIFPYTPQINLTYSANYVPTELTHSNYKIYNYTGSSVDAISVTGTFTAQDTVEANYMLAVMHFFKSVTKMFYGQDSSPVRGTPPPLCYLTGHGTYAFDNHPVAVTSFGLNYPDDVDYVNAGPELGGTSGLSVNTPSSRLTAAKLNPGGTGPSPKFSQGAAAAVNTRVPVKLQITLTCVPMVSRYDISNNFSLKDYASGKLLRASANRTGRGMW